jgi:hypothetical protein
MNNINQQNSASQEDNREREEDQEDEESVEEVASYLPTVFMVIRLILATALHERLGADSLLYQLSTDFNKGDMLVRLIADQATELYVAWPFYRLFSEFVEHRMMQGRLYDLAMHANNAIGIFDEEDNLILGMVGHMDTAETVNDGGGEEVQEDMFDEFLNFVSVSIIFPLHQNLLEYEFFYLNQGNETAQNDGNEERIQTWTLDGLYDTLATEVLFDEGPNLFITEAFNLESDEDHLLTALTDILTITEYPPARHCGRCNTVLDPTYEFDLCSECKPRRCGKCNTILDPTYEFYLCMHCKPRRCTRCNIPLPQASGATESDLCMICWRLRRKREAEDGEAKDSGAGDDGAGNNAGDAAGGDGGAAAV